MHDMITPSLPILGDRWWPQTAKREARKYSKNENHVAYGKKRTERAIIGRVSIRSRNGAPSRKAWVVNGQTTKASNK